jgi:regulator of RNase E activity RraA
MAAPLAAAPVVDAAVRLGLPVRVAPAALRRLVPGEPISGRALPCGHAGSVDIFLEAIGRSEPGDVLVIDDAGRTDQACIGDLVTLEAKQAGLAAIVVWGVHRDSRELVSIGLPIWSLGSVPAGPRTHRAGEAAMGEAQVAGDLVVLGDVVVADDDGVAFLEAATAPSILALGREIADTERRQADAMRQGRSLREQLRFDEYLSRRAADSGYDLRRHLREGGGAVET